MKMKKKKMKKKAKQLLNYNYFNFNLFKLLRHGFQNTKKFVEDFAAKYRNDDNFVCLFVCLFVVKFVLKYNFELLFFFSNQLSSHVPFLLIGPQRPFNGLLVAKITGDSSATSHAIEGVISRFVNPITAFVFRPTSNNDTNENDGENDNGRGNGNDQPQINSENFHAWRLFKPI